MDVEPRFTLRCQQEDLPTLPDGIAAGIERKILNRIDTNSIETGDRYLAVSVPKMFTEHQGDFRAVTWYDEGSAVIWACKVGPVYPNHDDTRDVYEVARRLADDERLLPTHEDYLELDAARLRQELARWRAAAQRLRVDADATGEANGFIYKGWVWLRRLDECFYELSFEQRIAADNAQLLITLALPDALDVEWANPERDRSGVLYQSVFVLTAPSSPQPALVEA